MRREVKLSRTELVHYSAENPRRTKPAAEQKKTGTTEDPWMAGGVIHGRRIPWADGILGKSTAGWRFFKRENKGLGREASGVCRDQTCGVSPSNLRMYACACE